MSPAPPDHLNSSLYKTSLYDANLLYSYSPDDTVFVYNNKKPFYHAKVLDTVPDEDAKEGRIHVEYLGDKSTYWVRAKYLVPVYPAGSIAVCATTHHYRRLANSQVFKTDNVLEIGCDFGETTKLLAQRCEMVYGVDKCVEHVEEAKRRHAGVKNVDFVAGDVLKDESLLKRWASCDKVFIDINGNRPREHVETCVELVRKLIPSARVIVVKSKEVFAALS